MSEAVKDQPADNSKLKTENSEPPSDPPRRSIARSAGIVSIAVMGSRVLGLVRELVFAAFFGAGFATSYGDKYPSDPAFAPVFEELNRRKALCYFHPLAAACCGRIFPGFPEEANLLEIPYDTARTVMGLLLSGAFVKYRDIKWLFSHSGGAIPMFAGRFRRLTQGNDLSKIAPDGIDQGRRDGGSKTQIPLPP